MKKNCEDCIDTDIADWEINENTGKATPILWCERYKKLCSDISECGNDEVANQSGAESSVHSARHAARTWLYSAKESIEELLEEEQEGY